MRYNTGKHASEPPTLPNHIAAASNSDPDKSIHVPSRYLPNPASTPSYLRHHCHAAAGVAGILHFSE